MKEKISKSNFLLNLKNKPLWIGFVISFLVVIITVSISLVYKGYEYQKVYVDTYAKQIIEFPEFKIDSEGLVITSGEAYDNVINGMLMIVDDERKLSAIIYDCLDRDFDNAILIGKDGIANIKNDKLMYYEEFAENHDLEHVEVSDAQIKMMVLDSEFTMNFYFEYLPILIGLYSISMWILMYIAYSSSLWVINKFNRYKFKFKEILNIISYTCLVPVCAFVFYYFFGVKNVWMMGALQVGVLLFYLKVFKYYSTKKE